MEYSFATLSHHWLTEGEPKVLHIEASEGDVLGQAMAIPAELGHGYFDLIQLPFGTSFFKGVQSFHPAASGQLLPVGEFDIDYGEPCFMVQTVRGGRICHREFLPEATLLYEQGRDLFCHMTHRRVIPMADGTFDSDMVALCLRMSSLRALLGEAETAALLETLGITALPAYSVRTMPKALASILHDALAQPLKGSAQKVFLQAKAIEYLTSLSRHLETGRKGLSPAHGLREAVQSLHAWLQDLEGKPPSLEDLARRFGYPARRLNAAFTVEYSVSIHAFIAGHRLEEARAALLDSEVPVEDLSRRMGYSHVNHFYAAFKRRFGHPPGSLRRNAWKACAEPPGEDRA